MVGAEVGSRPPWETLEVFKMNFWRTPHLSRRVKKSQKECREKQETLRPPQESQEGRYSVADLWSNLFLSFTVWMLSQGLVFLI
jgi:hypothetical protein